MKKRILACLSWPHLGAGHGWFTFRLSLNDPVSLPAGSSLAVEL